MTTLPHPATLRTLVLPGWLDSGPDHWQTRWERQHGFRRVQQDDWQWPRRGDWMARLEDELLADERPAVLVAHSLGCHLVAAWAAHSRHVGRVRAAWLVAPPDLDRPDLPPQLASWRPTLRRPLPMPAQVVMSDDDPFGAEDATLQLAADWQVPTWRLPGRGHLNAESGLGDWEDGLARLQALVSAGHP
ncbi:MAG: alpha/beta hydrolase [Rubrivivax sp.]